MKRMLKNLILVPLALFGANALAAPVLINQVVFGGAGDQAGNGIDVSGGNVYFAGRTAAGAGDGVLGRYSGTLTAQWSQLLGGSSGNLSGVAVSNKVYASGDSRPPALTVDTVGGAENKGVTAATGLGGGAYNFRTQTPAAPGFFPYGGTEWLSGVAVSNSGGTDSVYVVGGGEAWGTYGHYGMGLAKLSEAGSVLATATHGGGGIFTAGNSVTTLGSNVVAVGVRGSQAFIRSYDSNLVLQWSNESLTGEFRDITAYSGDLYAVGVSGTNSRVARYSSAGGLLWSQIFPAVSLNGIVGLNGHMYAVGGNGSDSVLLDLDPLTGSLIGGIQTFGGTGTDVFNGIAANPLDGSLYAVGTTNSSSLGASGNDMWIVHLAAAAVVPEPGSFALLLLGALPILATRRRALRKRAAR